MTSSLHWHFLVVLVGC
jgi:hypothetical protein